MLDSINVSACSTPQMRGLKPICSVTVRRIKQGDFMENFPVESMPQIVRDFASYKLTIQCCSQKTVNEYLSDLRLFFKYVYAKRYGVDLYSDFFDKIDISRLDNEFIFSVATEEIYDFFVYVSNVI